MFRFLLTLSAGLLLFLPGASAQGLLYSVLMNGPSESPPNASPGTGTGTVLVDTTSHQWHLHVDFSGLTGDMHKIVSYEAKWIHGTIAYEGTKGVCPAPLTAAPKLDVAKWWTMARSRPSRRRSWGRSCLRFFNRRDCRTTLVNYFKAAAKSAPVSFARRRFT